MSVKARWIGALVVVAAMVWVGCGDDDGTGDVPDGGTGDTGPIDMGRRDMGRPEDMGPPGPPRDMGSPEDTGPREMGRPEDMGMPDEPCDSPGESEELACGMCGTQTRFCTSDRVWEYGDCDGEHGVCEAGTTGMIACGPDMMIDARCTDACTWEPIDPMVRCPSPACADPLELAGRIGETVSIDVDTTTSEPGTIDLGAGCGGAVMAGETRPPQAVIALSVPGTGLHVVTFSLLNDGTDVEFDTVVQVREDCSTIPPDTGLPSTSCFDDTNVAMMMDFRSSGSFAAMGGSTVFLVVTGFSYGPMPPMGRTVAGRARVEVTVGDEAAPPTLTMATVAVSPDLGTFTFVGGDADGDATSARLTFLDAGGAAVDRDGSGMVDGFDDYVVTMSPPVTGMTSFTSVTEVPATFLADELSRAMATRARVVLLDALGAASAPITVDVALVTFVGLGGACDAMHVCRAPLACTMGTCQVGPEVAAACAAATTLTLAGTPPAASATGTIPAGDGLFEPAMCGGGASAELVYRVTVPAGAWDLVATNHNAGTMMGADTVLHIRSTCADPSTEVACNDDAMEPRAEVVALNVVPGDYVIFQDRFSATGPGVTTPFQLDVRLRAVVGAGMACDAAGVASRCATGTCTAGMCPP